MGGYSVAGSLGSAEGGADATGGYGGGADPGSGNGYSDGGRATRKSNGMIRGPGTGTSDNIYGSSTVPGVSMIKVSPEEMIIPADTVAKFGEEFFTNLIKQSHRPVRR
jgi:hypothetical protein